MSKFYYTCDVFGCLNLTGAYMDLSVESSELSS